MQDLSQDAWQSLQPVLYRAQQASVALQTQALYALYPLYAKSSELVGPLLAECKPSLDRVDAQLVQYRPWQVALASALLAWTLIWLLKTGSAATASVREKGAVQTFFDFGKSLPIVSGIVQRETDKIIAKLRASMEEKEHTPGNEPMTSLPSQGTKPLDILSRLRHKEGKDVRFETQRSKVSGTLYLSGEDHLQLLADAYSMFAHTNPMHSDVFPSVRRMEAEVVNMTASLLGKDVVPSVCGAMTSGGTESILTAVKAARDYMCAKKGIRHPEMIIAQSAHAAFFKAAEYFKIRLIKVPVGRDYRLSPASVRRALTSNTVLVVCSSPGFPHGVMDPVPEIAAITRRAGVCLHSDACLGGFVLPFARKLGYSIPPFDFSVPGVTSMSADTHKFGQAHKGTSVVLYRGPEYRRFQYTSITEWSGGLYISPGFAGSRSGALIASAWAALVHLGEEGYLAITRDIMQATDRLRQGVQDIPGLEVIGDPKMSVVAFKAAKGGPDIYRLNDALSRKGWHFSALQLPPALHMCLTAAHVGSVPDMVQDIREGMEELQRNPKASSSGGMAPVYGMGAKSPDRGLISEFLVAYQDVLLSGV